MVHGLPTIKVHDVVCEKCCESKQPRNSFKSKIPVRSEKKLEVIFSDVCGPFEVKSLGRNNYFASFIDEYTRMTWVYLIKKKSEVFETFKSFKVIIKKQK